MGTDNGRYLVKCFGGESLKVWQESALQGNFESGERWGE